MSKSCTLVEPKSFSLRSNASLEQGRIFFADESSSAAIKLKLSSGSRAKRGFNPHDAGQHPPGGRYYVYAKCERNRQLSACVRVGRQVSAPEYTGDIMGMLWEKFTPFVVERSGEIRLSVKLGAGATLERFLVLREPYPYWVAKTLPESLRDEILDDLRRFVRPTGVREVESGIVMSFERGDRDIHCMAWDGKYVWCGFCLSPSTLLRVNPTDMSTKRIRIKDSGGLHSLVFDGESLWAIHMGYNPRGKSTPSRQVDKPVHSQRRGAAQTPALALVFLFEIGEEQ